MNITNLPRLFEFEFDDKVKPLYVKQLNLRTLYAYNLLTSSKQEVQTLLNDWKTMRGLFGEAGSTISLAELELYLRRAECKPGLRRAYNYILSLPVDTDARNISAPPCPIEGIGWDAAVARLCNGDPNRLNAVLYLTPYQMRMLLENAQPQPNTPT